METNEIKALRAGYYVDIYGNLTRNGKILRTMEDDRGYLVYHASLFSEKFSLKVHRLQAFIKFGELLYMDNMQVRHLNGNSRDNSYENIDIGTPHDNQMDIPVEVRLARVRGRKKCPNEKGDSIYDIEKIVMLYKSGHSYTKIMKIMGIRSRGHLSRLINKTAKYRGLL